MLAQEQPKYRLQLKDFSFSPFPPSVPRNCDFFCFQVVQQQQPNAVGPDGDHNANRNNAGNNNNNGLLVDINNLLQDIQDVEADEFPFVE